MLVATQVYSAYDVDREARVRVQNVVDKGLHHYCDELAHKAIPQTYWDEAVAHLDTRFDPVWAGEYIGSYFWETAGFESSLIVDRDNRLVYASEKGDPAPSATASRLFDAARPLIAKVRAAERARPPYPPPPLPDSLRIESIVEHSPVRIGDQIYFLSGTLIQADKHILPKTGQAPIVFLAKKVDPAMVKSLANRFELPNARFEPTTIKPTYGRAAVQLTDPTGRNIANLSWDAPSPGMDFLKKIGPALIAFSVLLAVVTFFVLRTSRRMARSLIASEAAAHQLAFHDALTGLPNRSMLDRIFARRLAEMGDGGRPFAVLCIDLDLFKAVNDSLGHLAGDELIRRVGERLRRICREGDFLARFGGDEFVILQSNARRARGLRLAERIVAALAEPVQLEAGRVMVGASVGIVVADDADLDSVEYLRRADLALYRAKENGRNTHAFFEAEMDHDLRDKQRIRTQLHDALLTDALEMRYQPQVDRDGQMVGVEALARWTDEVLGEVPAAHFVEVAEESGLIDSLGQFTIRQAFKDARRWPTLRIAVNISAVQLRQRGFPEWLKSVADEQGIDPARVELEITERILLGDDSRTQNMLGKLRRYRFRIVLDDFGTGYSSLSYLQRYPIDKVKIDRTFVGRIGEEEGAEAIVVAIVRLTKALGLDVIAEGVETEAQRLTLAVAGCSEVQGYLTGRPMRAEEIDGQRNGGAGAVAAA